MQKIKEIKRTSGSHTGLPLLRGPSVWEGTIETGEVIWIRYRDGWLEWGVGGSLSVAEDNADRESHSIRIASDGSYMSEEDLVKILSKEFCFPSVPKDGTCCSCGYSGTDETECTKREDKSHCEHWWDGPIYKAGVSIPYCLKDRAGETWSPAMRAMASEVIKKFKQAKPEDRQKIVAAFRKWIEDNPFLQF